MKVNEEFLYFIWRHAMFNQRDLLDEEGQEIIVIDKGIYNTNAGPDFLEAKIKIGKELWAGSVEFHMKPSDWFRHNHQHDERYSNVILHVVYECEGEKKVMTRLNLPTLSLKGRIPKKYLDNYSRLKFEKGLLPCKSHVKGMSNSLLNVYYEALLIERFEQKLNFIESMYKKNQNDLESTIYQLLAYSWGLKINKDAFLLLAEQLPINLIRKYRGNQNVIEALVLGHSGLMPYDNLENVIVSSWQGEYKHLKTVYGLTPIAKRLWYFFQLRPSAFPTIRLSLWATLLSEIHDFESTLLNVSLKQSLKFLKSLEVSVYWRTHYVFDVESKPRRKKMGNAGALSILINAIVPLRMFNARRNNFGQEKWYDVLEELSELPSEDNSILRKMMENGFSNKDAAQSQALIQLNQAYCISKKCLNCRIGNEIIRIT